MSWIQVWHIAEMHPEPKIKSYKKKPAAPVEGKFSYCVMVLLIGFNAGSAWNTIYTASVIL